MTTEQFDLLSANVASFKLLLICLAKSHPKPSALHDSFAAERAFEHAGLLNSALSEGALAVRERQCDELEKAVWGHIALQVF